MFGSYEEISLIHRLAGIKKYSEVKLFLICQKNSLGGGTRVIAGYGILSYILLFFQPGKPAKIMLSVGW